VLLQEPVLLQEQEPQEPASVLGQHQVLLADCFARKQCRWRVRAWRQMRRTG